MIMMIDEKQIREALRAQLNLIATKQREIIAKLMCTKGV